MYFVKLTNKKGYETYVNLSLATDLIEIDGTTKIFFGNGDNNTCVKETPKKILSLPPVLKA